MLNGTNSTLNVTFDRPMRASTFTASDVLQIVGPIGSITDPSSTRLRRAASISPSPMQSPTVFGTLDSTLTVPDFAGTFKVAKITVQLDLSHTNLSDLSAVLISPGGTKQVTLFGTGALGSEPHRHGPGRFRSVFHHDGRGTLYRVVPVHDEGPLRA